MSEINMPAGFGGLMRYKEEYESKIKFTPNHIVIMVLIVIAFIAILNIFFPITGVAPVQ